MIRSTNHSSYPRIAENPLDQQLRTVLRAHERGRASDDEVRAVQDEVATIVVADQARAFIDIVTDGMVRWEGPTSHLALHLDGVELRGLRRWFGTNLYERQAVVSGSVTRRGAFLVHDYEVAAGVALGRPVKTVLPGPVTFSRLARDNYYRNLGSLAEAVAEVLVAEVAAVAAAGCRCFQLDEPLLCAHPEDLDLVADCTRAVFEAAGKDSVTILSTYFGDLTSLGSELHKLPGTHLGIDLVGAPDNYELLAGLPEHKHVSLGLFEARTSVQEDAADVAAKLEPHRETLTARDVIVGPNAGLELLPRDQAFDKLLHSRYLVEKLVKDWALTS